jgi:predicted RNA-binding protein YlxR (DUF448 family)/ribosomal protein L7Ae-like RNA K-turn-binding protein
MSQRHEPVRTCVGCRQKDGRLALLRFVVAGDPPQLVPDVPRRASGRGVSIHPRRRCLDAAARNGGLVRGLRAGVPAGMPAGFKVDTDQLADWASGQYTRRFEGLLVCAYRSGHAVLGADRARDAMATQRAILLIVAADAADKRQELVAAADRLGKSCIVYADKAKLGGLFGRDTVGVVAVTDVDIAAELQHAMQCAALLAEAS